MYIYYITENKIIYYYNISLHLKVGPLNMPHSQILKNYILKHYQNVVIMYGKVYFLMLVIQQKNNKHLIYYQIQRNYGWEWNLEVQIIMNYY